MKFDAKILELLIAWKLAVETKPPPLSCPREVIK